jgi:hypothetical protein
MNWISLIGPAMAAAGVSSVIAVVGSVTTARRLRRLQADRLEFDFALAAHKLNLDNTLAAVRAAAERYDRDLSELKRTIDVIFGSIRLINSMACRELPYATEQGIFAR